MALRGGAGRRLQGNPLGGILRDLDRRSRTPVRGRRPALEAADVPPGPRGPRGPAGPPGAVPGAADVLTTDEGGLIMWEFPSRFKEPPVLTALAERIGPAMVTVEDVGETYAVLRVYLVGGERTAMAGAGVRVHVTAYPVRG